MEPPLINILIRTSNRPHLFARCLQSIEQQTYPHTHVIVGYDNDGALDYIPDHIDKVPVSSNKAIPYYYDLYCNQLKRYVNNGWFMFLDDDDMLATPTVLQELAQHLTGDHEAVVCQFLRNGLPKPRANYMRHRIVREGCIGLPCLVLHSRHKDLSGLDGYKAGDYRYIKTVTERVKTLFVPLVLVAADRRSHGQAEKNLP
jgi:glycosyltransferase involved in cell wall biosynthesis